MSNPESPNSEGQTPADRHAPPAHEQAGSMEPPAYDDAPAGFPQHPEHLAGVGYPPNDSYPHLTGAGVLGYTAESPVNQGYPAPPPGQFPDQGYPAGAYAPAPPAPAGRTMSIVGLILAILAPLIGLILSIIALVQLKKSNASTGLAITGIIVGAIMTVIGIGVGIFVVSMFVQIIEVCAQNGPGVWQIDGITYTCGG